MKIFEIQSKTRPQRPEGDNGAASSIQSFCDCFDEETGGSWP